jgi:hypothetical protein
MPKVQINCYCCGCTSTISFIEEIVDPDVDEGEEDTSVENYPEYCPMCGNHCSEEGDIDDSQE